MHSYIPDTISIYSVFAVSATHSSLQFAFPLKPVAMHLHKIDELNNRDKYIISAAWT
jgi:hypothetical protein